MSGHTNTPVTDVSAVVAPDELSLRTIQTLENLGPYGKDNPKPLVQLSNIRPKNVSMIKDKHLKFSLGALKCIWFNAEAYWPGLKDHKIDIIGELSVNRYNQRSYPQLIIRDARLSDSVHS